MKQLLTIIAAIALLTLTGCNGGSSDPAPSTPAPTFDVPEDSTVSDPEPEPQVIYSLENDWVCRAESYSISAVDPSIEEAADAVAQSLFDVLDTPFRMEIKKEGNAWTITQNGGIEYPVSLISRNGNTALFKFDIDFYVANLEGTVDGKTEITLEQEGKGEGTDTLTVVLAGHRVDISVTYTMNAIHAPTYNASGDWSVKAVNYLYSPNTPYSARNFISSIYYQDKTPFFANMAQYDSEFIFTGKSTFVGFVDANHYYSGTIYVGTAGYIVESNELTLTSAKTGYAGRLFSGQIDGVKFSGYVQYTFEKYIP